MIKTEMQMKAAKLVYDQDLATAQFFKDNFPDIYETTMAALRVVRAAQVCTSPCGDWQEQQKRDIEIFEALKPFQQSGSVAASEG